jgi:hypothetical protein
MNKSRLSTSIVMHDVEDSPRGLISIAHQHDVLHAQFYFTSCTTDNWLDSEFMVDSKIDLRLLRFRKCGS